MAIILATETSNNKKAFAYGKRLLSSIQKQANLQRPSVHIRSSIFDKKLYTFKINIGRTTSLDKVLIIQRENKEDFVVTPQVEPSYFDMQYPQGGVYQITQMGDVTTAQKDTARQQFGNITWIGDSSLFPNDYILSYRGPTNIQVGFDTGSDCNGFQTAFINGVYTPYSETVYAKGKQLVQGLPTSETTFVVGAAYTLDSNNTRYLVLGVVTYGSASLPIATISEEPLDRGSNLETYTLKFFFTKDKPQNITLMQDGFAASSDPIWNVAEYNCVLSELPKEVGYFNSTGTYFFINNQKFDITAFSDSFTIAEDIMDVPLVFTGTKTITSSPYTTTAYGINEVWVDGTQEVVNLSRIKNNYPVIGSFGIGSGSFTSTTNTSRFVAALQSPSTPNPADPSSASGQFMFSGDADVFKELARYCPILMTGRSVRSETKPVNGFFQMASRTIIKAKKGNGEGVNIGGTGTSSDLNVQGTFKVYGKADLLSSFAKLGKFLFNGLSTQVWTIQQYLFINKSGGLQVDREAILVTYGNTIGASTHNPIILSVQGNDIHPKVSYTTTGIPNQVAVTALMATGSGSRYPLDTAPQFTVNQGASGVYLAAFPQSVSVPVSKGTLTTTLSAPTSITYGDILYPMLNVELRRYMNIQPMKFPTSRSFTVDGTPLLDDGMYLNAGIYEVKGISGPLTTEDAYDYLDPTPSFGSDTKTVVVAKAPLQVKVDDFSITYDANNPVTLSDVELLNISYTGWVAGDSEISNDLTGALSYYLYDPNGNQVAQTSLPGIYTVAILGLYSDNYNIEFINSSLTINKIAATIHVNTYSIQINVDPPTPLPAHFYDPLFSTVPAGLDATFSPSNFAEDPGMAIITGTINDPIYTGSGIGTLTVYPGLSVDGVYLTPTYHPTKSVSYTGNSIYHGASISYNAGAWQIEPHIEYYLNNVKVSEIKAVGLYKVRFPYNFNGLVTEFYWYVNVTGTTNSIGALSFGNNDIVTKPGGGIGVLTNGNWSMNGNIIDWSVFRVIGSSEIATTDVAFQQPTTNWDFVQPNGLAVFCIVPGTYKMYGTSRGINPVSAVFTFTVKPKIIYNLYGTTGTTTWQMQGTTDYITMVFTQGLNTFTLHQPFAGNMYYYVFTYTYDSSTGLITQPTQYPATNEPYPSGFGLRTWQLNSTSTEFSGGYPADTPDTWKKL